MTTNRFSSSQGDGISMALEAGASLTDMEQIQLLYLGNVKDGQLTKYPPRDVNGTDQIIFINKEGKRFVREDGRRDEICLAVMAQTDSMFYMLESGDGAGYVDITDPNWRSADGFTFDYLKENGYILVADTLEDLASQMGIDAATLKETVDSFNAAADGGTDEFGRTLYSTKAGERTMGCDSPSGLRPSYDGRRDDRHGNPRSGRSRPADFRSVCSRRNHRRHPRR